MILQDFRYGLRTLCRSPGFTAAAVLTLALGIGSNTAVFTLIRAVLLGGLPFRQPDRLVALDMTNSRTGELAPGMNWRDAADFRDQNHTLAGVGLQGFAMLNFSHGAYPEALYGARISASVLPLLGIQPSLGRWFTASEDSPGAAHVIILSDNLWRSRFGADPSIVGKTVPLVGQNAREWLVIGVMPPEFNFPAAIHNATLPARQMAFWIPLIGGDPPDQRRETFSGAVIARLRDGVSLPAAQADLSGIAARLAREYPATNANRGVRVVPLAESEIGRSRGAMLIVFAATGLVVLIGCVNIAGLLLVRAAARARETAIRQALGASRTRLLRQWTSEALLIAMLGGIAGVLLAAASRNLVVALAPPDLPGLARVRIDGLVLAFTAAVSTLAGLLFGVAPAWQSARANPQSALSGGRGTVGPRRGWGGLLVTAEIALAVLLTIAAGLLMKSLAHLLSVDLGYRPAHVLTAVVGNLPPERYGAFSAKVEFYRRVLAEVRAIPGVESAGAVIGVPLSGNFPARLLRIEGAPETSGDARPKAEIVPASEGYLETIGIPVLRGREWTAEEVAAGRRLALINEVAAARFWPGRDPIGKRFSIDVQPGQPWLEVIGIVKATHEDSPDQPPSPAIYLPMEQAQPFFVQFLAVRTAATPGQFAEPLRRAVARVDKDQPVFLVASMQSLLDTATSGRRFATFTLGIFAALALIMAAAGIYGVASYSVARRTQEIGVRMALGATRSQVARLILGRGLTQAGVGIVLGLCAAWPLTRVLASLLYGVTATDPAIFLSVPAILLAVQLAACYLPACRAMRVDPAAALRTE
ncbi:MAG TPA: ABC transporter permease [Bryobacteraceae bacterium]|nr:ABC transporter permease [Bryobacteraceae bacterium]